jgi:hypothetical protein
MLLVVCKVYCIKKLSVVVVGGWFLRFMLELSPVGVVVQRGCRAVLLAGMPGL